MPLVGSGHLAALALAGLQTAAPAAPCGCAQFALDATTAEHEAVLSPKARQLRDFVLFSHRRIGADLILRQGPYLDTLADAFPHCADRAAKLAWFRQALASTSDTRVLAERIARQADGSRPCPLRAR